MNRLRAVFSFRAAADLSLAPVGKSVDKRAGIFVNRCLAQAATRCPLNRQMSGGGLCALAIWLSSLQMAYKAASAQRKRGYVCT